MGSSLRRFSQKDARDATQRITLQTKEGAHRKSTRVDGSHKRLAFGFPQVLEPAMSDSPYVSAPDSETTKTDYDVMWLDSGEWGAPSTHNDFDCVEK